MLWRRFQTIYAVLRCGGSFATIVGYFVGVAMSNADVIAVMRLSGASEEQIAKAAELFPVRQRRAVKAEAFSCPACGCKALAGDFVCGTCSELKMANQRRFWQHVADRREGYDGRVIYGKPEPQPGVQQIERPTPKRYLAEPGELAPERKPLRREFLVTIGLVGRVIVAPSAAQAARIAHVINGDGPTIGHSTLHLGWTIKPETEAVCEKVEAKIAPKPTVERIFRVSGPGYEREMKLAVVAGSDKR